ncbi:phage protease [Burkholderia cenocepacia]|uniref:phage protease n=1 Tax=Burkholderia cenocepacia TaxID=95486 RepID=UPI001AA19D96|nr:phage protease [Burkholderia cenocepacia]MBO1856841.1 phage protease [Burkholderia cenocepacia]
MKSRPSTAAPLIAVAACSIDAQTVLAGRAQIFPMGVFNSAGGSMLGTGPWKMTPEIGARLVGAAAARENGLSFDYEHQTLRARENGKPAPAAGWFKTLEVRDDGVWATDIKWTAAARQMIESGEYRYTSPVFTYDEKTGEVTSLFNVALTNTPAIDGMDAVAACAIAALSAQHTQEINVNKLLAALLPVLGLKAESTEDDAIAALSRVTTQIGTAAAGADYTLDKHLAALGSQLTDTRTALAAASAQPGTPDPTKFVPMDQLVAMQNQVAALSAKYESRERDELLEQGLADGRILPAQKDYWRDQPIAALSAYLKVAQPMAALARMQSGGFAPAGSGSGTAALSADQEKIAKSFGIAPDKFAEQLANSQARG